MKNLLPPCLNRRGFLQSAALAAVSVPMISSASSTSSQPAKPGCRGSFALDDTRVRFFSEAIDNSTYEILPEQLTFFQKQVDSGVPLVLMMHIPMYAPGRPIGFGCGHPEWGAKTDRNWELQEGDLQVPEGLYKIESLNPNSRYHLALRFDKMKGKFNGREDLGCDIMIHGKNCSVGCLAMGNSAAEELFILAAETGIEKISVILSPTDFRTRELPAKMPEVPEWTPELYATIREELIKLN
ncbi:MAG: hypothetical protein PF904_13665 [Kiritimatiellae bacterium]|jgi:hypothetical protein|nr:hypothetical protein [Kiritimatiellia bacterium]